jgi:UDP-N-acetylglucosamine--N-acetylmuramyl-(pentapeptide) pyrophosphoryl-undecaprenol N-acetylglucosamine transferase
VSNETIRILIAAGGTGGHVFPAIAIADEIKKINPQAEFLFVGTSGKIEARAVPQHGYAFAAI